MEVSELRKKVVEYMYKNAEYEWTPEKSFILYNPGTNGCTRMFCVFKKGVVYKGLPYINITMSQPETFDEMRRGAYIPFEGTEEELDAIDSPEKLFTVGGKTYTDAVANAFTFPGNDCIFAVLLAWNNIINNRDEVQRMQVIVSSLPGKKSGVAAVGDYDYSNYFDDDNVKVIEANGEQKIARCYAQLQPGDATSLLRAPAARHWRMVVKEPHVEYIKDENGNEIIDLENSFITELDQAGGAKERFIVGENRSTCHVVDHSFSKLLKEGSLPISLPELLDGAYKDEETSVKDLSVGADGGRIVLRGSIESNRQIISVRAKIYGNGVSIERREIPRLIKARNVRNYHRKDFDLASVDFSSSLLKTGETYTFELYTVVSGDGGKEKTLVKDKTFTA